jgi:hypothetical protein
MAMGWDMVTGVDSAGESAKINNMGERTMESIEGLMGCWLPDSRILCYACALEDPRYGQQVGCAHYGCGRVVICDQCASETIIDGPAGQLAELRDALAKRSVDSRLEQTGGMTPNLFVPLRAATNMEDLFGLEVPSLAIHANDGPIEIYGIAGCSFEQGLEHNNEQGVDHATFSESDPVHAVANYIQGCLRVTASPVEAPHAFLDGEGN